MKGLFKSEEIEVLDVEFLELMNRKQRLETLLNSNLDFKNENNNNLRHSCHAFPAKFPPKLARLFIKNLSEENDTILDPMMGSATTLLEADLLNRVSYGFDIDPLSLIIGKAKFQNIDSSKVLNMANKILSSAIKMNYSSTDLGLELKKRFDPETEKFINFWFTKRTQKELLSLIQEIERIDNESYKLFFKMIFSSIIITKSGGVTLALDLAHTRPHKNNEKKVKPVFEEFSNKVKKITQNLSDIPSRVTIDYANSKKLPLKDEIIDLIITSPPYANNAIDYMRAHKFSLVWFGMSIKELRDIRKNYIGSENSINADYCSLPNLSTQIVNELKTKNTNKGNILHKYYSEMLTVFTELYRVLKFEGGCIFIVASSTLNGINTQTHKCFVELAELVGFETVGMGIRNLDRDRRMMPFGHKPNNSSIESRMHQEYVLGFWK